MKTGLEKMGYNIGKTETPLIPVIIGDEAVTYKMVIALEELGVIVDGVSYPAVKRNLSRIRMRIMATHTEDDINMALAAFKKVGKFFNII